MKTTRYRFVFLTAWDKSADFVQDCVCCHAPAAKQYDVFTKLVDWIELS